MVFQIQKRGTSTRVELLAGLTTFVTMAYILVVNPVVLATDFAGNPTGLDPQAVFLATALAAALATAIMGLYANLPIAQAPGMGNNHLFVSVVMSLGALGIAQPWRVALACVFFSGLIFLILSLLKIRKAIIDALSPSMRAGISVGIGLFITFIGLKNAGLIIGKPGTLLGLNLHPTPAGFAVFLVGLLVMTLAHARKWPGSILLGVFAGAAAALAFGVIQPPQNWLGLPRITEPAVFRLDLAGALTAVCIPFVLIFAFTDLFDTIGTLVGVTERAGLVKNGELPNANRALISDASATMFGALLGTSTVTSYIESAAGIEQGGRTGLTAVTAAVLFAVSIVLAPIVGMIASHPSITAPALIFVGLFMAASIRHVAFDDLTEGLPAFLIAIGIPLSFSIADGLTLGLLAYPTVKLVAGRAREVRAPMWIVAAGLIAFLVFVRARMG